jgi:hypothetical protein
VADIQIDFGSMKEVTAGSDYSAPFFSQKEFNFSGYEKMASFVSSQVRTLEVGERGRTNPFLP